MTEENKNVIPVAQSIDNTQLTNDNNMGDNNINANGNTNQAAPSSAEDATVSGYQFIIDSQNKTIEALIAQNQTLQTQIANTASQWEKAIRQGAAFNQVQQPSQVTQPLAQPVAQPLQPDRTQSLTEPYQALRDMDFRITKQDMM